MKKITKLASIALLLTSVTSTAFADNWNIGASASYGNIDGTASDTQLDNRTSTTVAQTRGAKDGDADFPFASIFLEYAKTMDKDLDLIFGLDYVPFKAEIDSKSFADLNTTGSVASNTSGTRKATLELKDYATLYLQPTYKIGGGTAVFGKVGYIHGDVTITGSNTATGSTINATDTLNGYVVGLGVQHNINKNVFVRLEGNYTDHDNVTATDSLGTKFTADSEIIAGKLSIGYSF